MAVRRHELTEIEKAWLDAKRDADAKAWGFRNWAELVRILGRRAE
jgi:hypothetical protein